MKIDFTKEGKPKRKRSGNKKRSSGSFSSSEAQEETLLIRHFVTQLIDRACSIVIRDTQDETQTEERKAEPAMKEETKE